MNRSDGGENSGGGEMRRIEFLLTVSHLTFMMTIAQCKEKNPLKGIASNERA